MVTLPHTNYFEGTLQLRNPSEKLLEFVKMTVQQDGRAVITKVVPVKGGVDCYLSSQKYLQILGRKLRKHFSGEYKLTSTLHTQNRMGKLLYRVTILFREHPFKKDSVVEVHGESYIVLRWNNREVACKNTHSGKKETFKLEQVRVFSSDTQ